MSKRWEKIYENYNQLKTNGTLDQELAEKLTELEKEMNGDLKIKIDERQATSEEYNKYERLKKQYDEAYRKYQFRKSIYPKVDNLIEAIDALDNNLFMLKEEFFSRREEETHTQEKANLDKKIEGLEEEIENDRENAREAYEKALKIKEEIKEISEKIKDKQDEILKLKDDEKDNDKDEKIASLNEEINELSGSQKYLRTKRDNFFAEHDSIIEKIENKEIEVEKNKEKRVEIEQDTAQKIIYPELKELSVEELKNEIWKTVGQISRCKLAAEMYLNATSEKDLGDISLKLAEHKQQWQGKKFTLQDKIPLTKKERQGKITEGKQNRSQEGKGKHAKVTEDRQNRSQEGRGKHAKVTEDRQNRNQERRGKHAKVIEDRQNRSQEERENQNKVVEVQPTNANPQKTENRDTQAELLVDIEKIRAEARVDIKRKHWFRNFISLLPWAKKSQNMMMKFINNEIDARIEKECLKAKLAIEEVDRAFAGENKQADESKEKVENARIDMVSSREDVGKDIASRREDKRAEFRKWLSSFEVEDLAEKGIKTIEYEKNNMSSKSVEEKKSDEKYGIKYKGLKNQKDDNEEVR